MNKGLLFLSVIDDVVWLLLYDLQKYIKIETVNSRIIKLFQTLESDQNSMLLIFMKQADTRESSSMNHETLHKLQVKKDRKYDQYQEEYRIYSSITTERGKVPVNPESFWKRFPVLPPVLR